MLVFMLLVCVSTYAVGLPDEVGNTGEALVRSLIALGVSAGFVSLFALLAGTPLLPRFVVLVSIAVLAPLDALACGLASRSRSRGARAERVLAVIDDDEAALLALELDRMPERPAGVVAALQPQAFEASALQTLASIHDATLIVLDRAAQSDDQVVAEAASLHRGGVRIRTLSLFYDEWLGKLPIQELERISLMFDIHEIHRPSYARMKRVVDLAVAIPGVMLFAMMVPFVAVADLVANPGPLLYRQTRVGKDGREFAIVKFRTMQPSSAPSSWTSDDDPRLTKVGRYMRRTHLDEVPQFLNVLRRDLSIVGPRPEQPHYVDALRSKIPYYDLRHLVRPGMTGWAQVKYGYGGTEVDAVEKLQYEFYYLRHQGIMLDFRILGRTLRTIVGRSGR